MLGGNQSALNPQGPGASEISELSWLLFAGAAAIFAVVGALAVYAIVARRHRRAWMARSEFVVAAGIVFPLLVLTGLLVHAFLPGTHTGPEAAMLRIEIVGEQWWWRVHYLNEAGHQEFATANEIRIPAGRPVELLLRSADVIHSFWVPNLAPKLDMIPGRVNRLRLAANVPGEFRGQCAEYCGGPHARMALYVIAMSADEFEAWRAQQQRPAIPAATDSAERGRILFSARGCGVCHTVRGSPAEGLRGPDLTHVGSRISLAAGTLRNDAASLATWIRASQHVKPENLMPSFDMLPAEELGAIAAYLESLR